MSEMTNVRALSAMVAAASVVLGVCIGAQNETRVIADFDGDKVEAKSGLSMWPYADEQLGGTSEARVTLVRPGAHGSRGALRIAFTMTDEFRPPFASAWAMVGPEGLTTDVSAYRGVRFAARSATASAFTAGIVRFAGTTIRYATPFETSAEWKVVELPFDAFKAMPTPTRAAADAPAFDPKNVTSVGFAVRSELRGHFDLDVDRIEFYR